ncbi:MAG: zinc-ribbon domain-containing protein [Alphaproteobacteria bacterium]
MILTCPQCATRYLLPAHTLAPEGRRVKCSSCKEVWFQLPDTSEIETPRSDFDEIPHGVRPLPEGANLPTLQEEEQLPPDPRARAAGYAAAAAVFFAIFGGLLLLQGPIIKNWPFSKSFYAMLGHEFTVPGQGLAFDALAVQAASDSAGEKILITGKIVNPSEKGESVPMIEAQMVSAQGEVLERWVIRPPAPEIAAQADLSFSTDYLIATPGTAHTVSLHFIPGQR